jgi:hypothetical protein
MAPPVQSAQVPAAPARQAQVSYQMGQLLVITENSSLDQILREIARKTGMKITGSVADERVYGTYGPAAPAKVLSVLLDGSGNNMMLRENAASEPVELVLTPMQGMPVSPVQSIQTGGTPSPVPSSSPALVYTPSASTPPASQDVAPSPPPQQGYIAPQPGNSQPGNEGQPGDGATAVQPSPPDADVPQSPNGVHTPQQIFEQLRQLQQQKAQPPATSQ